MTDPLAVVFNDSSALRLFQAYSRSIWAVFRNHNGNLIAEVAVTTTPVPGQVSTPFEDTLRQLLKDKNMACIPGSLPGQPHQVFTLPIELERSSSYTLDFESRPVSGPPDPLPDDPKTPFYRISFHTSRFASAQELAEWMRTSRIQHRIVKSLRPLSPPVTDKDLENALLDATGEIIPAAQDPTVTLLWRASPGSKPGSETVIGLLIDSPEALWRDRLEPALVTVSSDAGDFQHYVMKPRPCLQIQPDPLTASWATTAAWTRSPGGTRTLIAFGAGQAAQEIKLQLRQDQLQVLGASPSFTSWEMLSISIPGHPPWSVTDV